MKIIGISDIEGFRLGNAENKEKGTGCTVIVCEDGAVGGVDVRGGGPATRETDLLRSENTVNAVNAVVLSGGSAFGLEAASGVMRELAEEIERLNPGAAGMLREAEMESVRISGDEKYIELHADPKDSRYDLGAYLDCVLQGDGSIRLVYLTFAGNG